MSAPGLAAVRSTTVDTYAGYEPQVRCVNAALPGTRAHMEFVRRNWPAHKRMSTIRACGSGGTSEHKDGRAIDWSVDVANRGQRAAAYGYIQKVLASDAAGNPHALARRMGIMYIIFDDTIWSSYRGFEPQPYLNGACKTKKRCSRSLRHLDHVHISLSRAGAAAQTSWYWNRPVERLPVLLPGTRKLDYAQTALWRMEVPANGTRVVAPFKLAANTTYRLVATGSVKVTRSGHRADASCRRGSGGGWQSTVPAAPEPEPEPTEPEPEPTYPQQGDWDGEWGSGSSGSAGTPTAARQSTERTTGLLVNGRVRFSEQCERNHTYESFVNLGTTNGLTLRFVDPNRAGNSGTVTVWVVRDDITLGSLVRR